MKFLQVIRIHNIEVYKVEKYEDGIVWYNASNQLHRTDGPAVEWMHGSKEWYQNGKLHRADGPAVEYASGAKLWYQNGKPHRTDGPAVELADGHKRWYIDGVQYTQREFNKKTKTRNDPCNGKTVEIDGRKYELRLIN